MQAFRFVLQLNIMKKIASADLLEKLKADTRQVILQTNQLLQQDPDMLLHQPAEGKWSIAQIIEHLNSYGRYYLPLIRRTINNGAYSASSAYTPGWLGDYFTRLMLPKSTGEITNKMKAPKGHRPKSDLDSKAVLEEFLEQQQLLLELLTDAEKTHLGKVRIPISLSRFIRLKLGDTFRFIIAHHQRHFVQANKTVKTLKEFETVSLRFHGV